MKITRQKNGLYYGIATINGEKIFSTGYTISGVIYRILSIYNARTTNN